MKYDFGGWATRNDLPCSDGRVIKKDAFKAQNGQTVPLVWMHNHADPANVLGLAHLENRDEGVYAFCEFNDTESGKTARELVKHGDVQSLSIFANQLKQAVHHIHAAAFYQCELGITEQTAAAEQLIGDPHAVFGQCRDHPQLRGQDRKDPVCFPVLCFFQHQAHRHKGFHRLSLLSAVPDVCSRDTGECSPCRQTPASWPERSWGIPPSLHVLLDSVRYSSGIHARKICPVNGCCCSA